MGGQWAIYIAKGAASVFGGYNEEGAFLKLAQMRLNSGLYNVKIADGHAQTRTYAIDVASVDEFYLTLDGVEARQGYAKSGGAARIDMNPSCVVLGTIEETSILCPLSITVSNSGMDTWTAGPAAAPDGWTATDCDVARERTIVKNGSYSAKVTARANKKGVLYHTLKFDKYYKGQRLTFGAWVYAPSTNSGAQKISVADGAGGTSSLAIPKDDKWHFVCISHIVSPAATSLTILASVNTNTVDVGNVLYIDSFVNIPAK